jgi:hypothetical protein
MNYFLGFYWFFHVFWIQIWIWKTLTVFTSPYRCRCGNGGYKKPCLRVNFAFLLHQPRTCNFGFHFRKQRITRTHGLLVVTTRAFVWRLFQPRSHRPRRFHAAWGCKDGIKRGNAAWGCKDPLGCDRIGSSAEESLDIPSACIYPAVSPPARRRG